MGIIKLVVAFIGLAMLVGCHDETKRYKYPLAEDLNFRLGKWYSVTDSGTVGVAHNTRLDTIWFISDSLAGWTGFVPHQPLAYAYLPTYFSDLLHIVYVIQNPQDPTKMDTVSHQCGLTPSGDTMAIYWDLNTRPPYIQRYVKKKD